MNALVPLDHERFSIFTPRAQGEFLKSLQMGGNVRLACRAARVSAQTAYRARRRSPSLARAWDAALLAARDHAEAVLADRALNGVEEAVFYHGEEVARRRRYDSRLLLAHLARLDRMAERPEVQAALALLDGQIERLERGEALVDAVPVVDPADQLRCRQAQDERVGLGAAHTTSVQPELVEGHAQNFPHDRVPPVPPCRECGGYCSTPGAELGPQDCEYYDNRIARMEAARPLRADSPEELARKLGGDAAEIESFQLDAFEAEGHEWWLVSDDPSMMASILHDQDT